MFKVLFFVIFSRVCLFFVILLVVVWLFSVFRFLGAFCSAAAAKGKGKRLLKSFLGGQGGEKEVLRKHYWNHDM